MYFGEIAFSWGVQRRIVRHPEMNPEFGSTRRASCLNTSYSEMAVILLFFCLLANQPLLPRLRENVLLNLEFKNEATRANLQVNKRLLKWRPFWNKVNTELAKPVSTAHTLYIFCFCFISSKWLDYWLVPRQTICNSLFCRSFDIRSSYLEDYIYLCFSLISIKNMYIKTLKTLLKHGAIL